MRAMREELVSVVGLIGGPVCDQTEQEVGGPVDGVAAARAGCVRTPAARCAPFHAARTAERNLLP